MSRRSFSENGNAPAFTEGQLWHYTTREGEEGSLALINKIEDNGAHGKILHISISGVQVNNPHSETGLSRDLPHFPMTEAAMRNSVTTLQGTSTPNPDYLAGYKIWKAAFDEGEAGVFTVTLAELVSIVEETLSQS